jgi:hypothetical protein
MQTYQKFKIVHTQKPIVSGGSGESHSKLQTDKDLSEENKELKWQLRKKDEELQEKILLISEMSSQMRKLARE